MTPSPASWRSRRAGILLALLGVFVLLALGAWLLRAPKPPFTPEMIRVERDGVGPLWVQRHEVTLAQWNQCHDAGRCTLRLRPPPGRDAREWPATGLSYVDVSEFLGWINQFRGPDYRLPRADEWLAIAGPVLPEKPDPIFTDPSLSWASTYLTENLVDRALRPTGAWAKTPEGIADLNGNVWEWTADCYSTARTGQPADPSACPAFVVGGEHEAVIPYLVRDPARGGCAVGAPPAHLGMRLVRDEIGG